ncbi:MAG: CHAD domain-containing protein [Methyloceanibacter sp.]
MAGVGKTAREPREVEVKLEFDPADRGEIEAHPLLAATHPEKQTLISVYYDTDDLALQKARVALRVRKVGTRYLQAIKSMNGTAQLFERPEWEHEVAGLEPDLGLATDTALEPLLTESVRASLQPLFWTRIERTIYRLPSNGSDVEVAIDQGEIEAALCWSPVHELELELKQGSPADLFRLARSLAAALPLRLAVKTKAERGYELAGGATLAAEKAARLELDAGLTCQQAFRAIGENCLRQIIANEPGMCAGEAEALHQMRVGLRRLRAAIAVFAKAVADSERDRIKGELKWITSELGPARDLDVFAADVLKPLGENQAEDARLAEARRVFAENRAKAYAAAVGLVRSDRFRNVLLNLAEWIEVGPWTIDKSLRCRRERTVQEHAAKWLGRMRKRIRKEGARLRELDIAKRHKLRIRTKNLRYAIEFFTGVFPRDLNAKRREAALASLKELQDALGALNDLATREALIANGHDLADHVAGLQVSKEAEVDRLLDRAEAAHASFAKVKSFCDKPA